MAADIAGTLSVSLPGAERDLHEQILLQYAKPGTLGAQADECVVFAESTRLGALVRNRAIVPAALMANFRPNAARFQGQP
jgi:hypothetical protein